MRRVVLLVSVIILSACAQQSVTSSKLGAQRATPTMHEALQVLQLRDRSVQRVQAVTRTRLSGQGNFAGSHLVAIAMDRPQGMMLEVVDPLVGPVAAAFFDAQTVTVRDLVSQREYQRKATPRNVRRVTGMALDVPALMSLLVGTVPNAHALEWGVAATQHWRSRDGQWQLQVDPQTKQVTRVTKYRIGDAGDAEYHVHYSQYRNIGTTPLPMRVQFFVAGEHGEPRLQIDIHSIELIAP